MARVSQRGLVRRGVILLESLLALALVGLVATALLPLAGQALGTLTSTHEAERRMLRASALLDAVALWSSTELEQRLGTRPQGPWLLTIERPRPHFYTATISDSAHAEPLLETALFRGSDATQP